VTRHQRLTLASTMRTQSKCGPSSLHTCVLC